MGAGHDTVVDYKRHYCFVQEGGEYEALIGTEYLIEDLANCMEYCTEYIPINTASQAPDLYVVAGMEVRQGSM